MVLTIFLLILGILLIMDGIQSVRFKNKGLIRLSKSLNWHLKKKHIRNIGYVMIAIGILCVIAGILLI